MNSHNNFVFHIFFKLIHFKTKRKWKAKLVPEELTTLLKIIGVTSIELATAYGIADSISDCIQMFNDGAN